MLKKKINGSWGLLSNVKKKVNGAWADCDCVKKLNNGVWSTVWERNFVEWVFGDTNQPYGFASYSAYSRANGNIEINAANSFYSSNYIRICTTSNITMAQNETVYIDYSITSSGSNPFFEFFVRLETRTESSGRIYAETNIASGSGTVSMTRTGETVSAPIQIYFRSQVDSGSYAQGTLVVSKIYTDSKIYYWGTKRIV